MACQQPDTDPSVIEQQGGRYLRVDESLREGIGIWNLALDLDSFRTARGAGGLYGQQRCGRGHVSAWLQQYPTLRCRVPIEPGCGGARANHQALSGPRAHKHVRHPDDGRCRSGPGPPSICTWDLKFDIAVQLNSRARRRFNWQRPSQAHVLSTSGQVCCWGCGWTIMAPWRMRSPSVARRCNYIRQAWRATTNCRLASAVCSIPRTHTAPQSIGPNHDTFAH